MAFWIWAVAGMVFGLMLYEFGSWIKKKINPPEEMTEEARAEADKMQAELTRANMKIAVLESRLEEAKLEMEAQTTALTQQHKEQQAKTEAAYQRQMVTLSERMAANGRGDWRVAVQREKEQKIAAQDNYPVRMAVEVAAWKATTLGEEPGVDSAVSEGPVSITKENAEGFDEHDPAVNPLSEETAVPNSDPGALQGAAGANEIAAAVAAISGMDLTEIGAYSDDLQDADGDEPGEGWVLHDQAAVQTNGSNGPAAGEGQVFYEEEPVDIGTWLDDRDQEVLDQITVLDETAHEQPMESPDGEVEAAIVIEDYLLVVDEQQEAAHPAVDLASEPEVEPAEDGSREIEVDAVSERKSALMAGLAAGTVIVERFIDGSVDEDSALDGAPSELSAEADDTAPAAASADGEEIVAYENRWPDLADQAVQRAMARQLGSEMDADYLDDEEFLREMGIEQTAPQQELLSGAEAEEIMGAENWVVDPLEELANHINGESQDAPDAVRDDEIVDDESSGSQIEVADHLWEEMVYAGASAARENRDAREIDEDSLPLQASVFETTENDSDGASDPAEDTNETLLTEEPASAALDGRVDEEDDAIAATVAAIMSMAPDGHEVVESDPDWEPQAQQPPDNGRNGGSFDGPAPEAFIDEDPLAGVPLDENVSDELAADIELQERPSTDWQRQPVLWQAEYYDNTKLADVPVVVRQDREIDFQWRDRAPAQGIEPRTFSVRWSSRLPLEEGRYRFVASAPDGMRLWLNDRLVISAWYDQSEQTYQRDFSWRGGPIDVRVEHYENGGDAKAYLTWDRVA